MNTLTLMDNANTLSNYPLASPAKILQKLFTKQASGRLTIGDPNDESIQWRVFVGNGKLHFASSVIGHQERLSYFLSRYFPNKDFLITPDLTDDYDFIHNLWQSGSLSIQQVRQILIKLTQDALVQCLALPQASFHFEKTIGLHPLLLSVSGQELITPVKNQIRQWIQLRSEISSPFQRVLIQDLEEISSQTWIDSKYFQLIAKLKQLVNEQLCIYEIARHLSQHTLELSMLLQPLVNTGGIKMLPYKLTPKENRPLIACIDDSRAIQRIVKMTLEASGFRVISILEPTRAMTSFVTEKPELILMDINMPEIDGYKLSYMFRQSTLLRDIPIIMLTGRDGVLDRVRAKMIGAVDYISKPFIPQELLNTINTHLKAKSE